MFVRRWARGVVGRNAQTNQEGYATATLLAQVSIRVVLESLCSECSVQCVCEHNFGFYAGFVN